MEEGPSQLAQNIASMATESARPYSLIDHWHLWGDILYCGSWKQSSKMLWSLASRVHAQQLIPWQSIFLTANQPCGVGLQTCCW